MINSIVGTGPHIQVVNGFSTFTYISTNTELQGVGNVRLNAGMQYMEVFDGNGWIRLDTPHATVSLTAETDSLLEWAQGKRAEELQWKELAKNSQAVRIALNNL
jgi:hypothetical protein